MLTGRPLAGLTEDAWQPGLATSATTIGVDFLGRRSAGNLCYASHQEAARRLGLPVQ